MAKIGRFFLEYLKNFSTVGSVTPSSKALALKMAKQIEYKAGQVIIELGPGDGIITHCILDQMHEDSKLFVFEINKTFCQELKKIDDSRLVIINDGAEHMKKHLNENGFDKVDAIISALPLTSLPKKLTKEIIRVSVDMLNAGASFVQVHYSLLLKKMYKSYFNSINIGFVAKNIPPAFVFKMEVA